MKRTLTYVLHREKQGKDRVETREITTGADDGSFTEVRSGLKEGEEFIDPWIYRALEKALE